MLWFALYLQLRFKITKIHLTDHCLTMWLKLASIIKIDQSWKNYSTIISSNPIKNLINIRLSTTPKSHWLWWRYLKEIPYARKSVVDGSVYACASHLIQLKWAHCHTIVPDKTVRWNQCHHIHLLWLSDFEIWVIKQMDCNSKTQYNKRQSCECPNKTLFETSRRHTNHVGRHKSWVL